MPVFAATLVEADLEDAAFEPPDATLELLGLAALELLICEVMTCAIPALEPGVDSGFDALRVILAMPAAVAAALGAMNDCRVDQTLSTSTDVDTSSIFDAVQTKNFFRDGTWSKLVRVRQFANCTSVRENKDRRAISYLLR